MGGLFYFLERQMGWFSCGMSTVDYTEKGGEMEFLAPIVCFVCSIACGGDFCNEAVLSNAKCKV